MHSAQCTAVNSAICYSTHLTFTFILTVTLNQGLSKHQEVSSIPVTKVKNGFGLFGPFWCNKKIYPETYVPCGSYELLLSNVAHQMKEKLTIQNKFSHFLSQISLKFEICSFSAAQNNQKKKVLREIVNCISYLGCLSN